MHIVCNKSGIQSSSVLYFYFWKLQVVNSEIRVYCRVSSFLRGLSGQVSHDKLWYVINSDKIIYGVFFKQKCHEMRMTRRKYRKELSNKYRDIPVLWWWHTVTDKLTVDWLLYVMMWCMMAWWRIYSVVSHCMLLHESSCLFDVTFFVDLRQWMKLLKGKFI